MQNSSQIVTTNKPTPNVLQAGCTEGNSHLPSVAYISVGLLCWKCPEAEPSQPESQLAHSHRPAQKDRVYKVATDFTIRRVMAEYRRRKLSHLLPRSTSGTAASKPRPAARRKDSRTSKVTDAGVKISRSRSMSASSDPVDRQIVEQERASIMKVNSTLFKSKLKTFPFNQAFTEHRSDQPPAFLKLELYGAIAIRLLLLLLNCFLSVELVAATDFWVPHNMDPA